jgi:hypothetical protein
MKRSRAILAALGAAMRASLLLSQAAVGWFGHIRYATPLLHPDDHRHLAAQALTHLVKSGLIQRRSPLADCRAEVETGCGMLDIVESDAARSPGKLQWEYSHMYDPVAGRGTDERRYVNALEEYVDWWERALTHARIGNMPKAYRFLGYCGHLLQDMAVPSHTYCIGHGVRIRTADTLELLSRAKRFYLREPAGPPYRGEDRMEVTLFVEMANESRGREAGDGKAPNEIADVLKKYYKVPRWTAEGWRGAYRGEPYFPYHRLLPSSPKIELADLYTLRNFLMCRAAERTVQLFLHFADLTGTGDKSVRAP